MRSQAEVTTALALVKSGLNDGEVSRRLDIPRSTIVDWRHGRVPNLQRGHSVCDGCSGLIPHPPAGPYAYLLGIYLGDGCISQHPRAYAIRIMLDSRYPGIIDETASALEAVLPGKHAWRGRHGSDRCVVVAMYWRHWPCLIPQHGPGRKHLRTIALEPWQREIIEGHHEQFLRGLIHSDGCRVVANDRGVASVRYHFSNLSEDIKALYCASLDALGIPWTRPSNKDIAVYRKHATAMLDQFIGPKR